MNLNKVTLIGRLTQDPEMRTTPSGQSVTTVKLATNRVWNDQATKQKREATEYHTIICWGRLGEICGQYLKKGSMAFFEGRLQTRSWDDKTSGQKRYMTEIVAENMQIGPRPQGSSYQSSAASGQRIDSPTRQPINNRPQATEPEIPVINEDELTVSGTEEEPKPINDADLPF